jgi:hypothetical protein
MSCVINQSRIFEMEEIVLAVTAMKIFTGLY